MTASDSSRNPRNSGRASVDATQPGTRLGWWRSEITPLCLGSSEASQALAQVYAVAGSREHPPPSTSLLGGGGPAGIVGKVEEGGWMSENLTRPVALAGVEKEREHASQLRALLIDLGWPMGGAATSVAKIGRAHV